MSCPKLSLCHCCPQGQGVASLTGSRGATRRGGAVKTPVTAEPWEPVSSGSLRCWGCSSLPSLSAPHPALLLLRLGASTPSSLGTPWPVPLSHSLQGTVLFLPRPWEGQSSVLPNWGGKVCSCFCLFPMFIPHLSSPLAAAMECPWSSHIRSQIWLLALACSSTGSPCSPACPQQLLPWESQDIVTRTCCADVLLVDLLGSIPASGSGAGRMLLQAGILPGHGPSSISPSFPRDPASTEAFGVGLLGGCLCQWMSLGKGSLVQPRHRCGQTQSWPRAAIASPGTGGLVGLYRTIVTCNFL